MSRYRLVERPNAIDPSIMTQRAFNPEGQYIGDAKTARFLCDEKGIVPELAQPHHSVCSIGFCEAEQKWYGWSHRAIFGFGIGSAVKKGDCAYTSDDPDELLEDHVSWLGPEREQERRSRSWVASDRSGIFYVRQSLPEQVGRDVPLIPAEELRAVLSGEKDAAEFPGIPDDVTGAGIEFTPVGRGEWTAQTLEDARQMAMDFAEGVA